MTRRDEPMRALLDGPVAVVNIGLESFAATLDGLGVSTVQVDWAPPAGGDRQLIDILDRLGA